MTIFCSLIIFQQLGNKTFPDPSWCLISFPMWVLRRKTIHWMSTAHVYHITIFVSKECSNLFTFCICFVLILNQFSNVGPSPIFGGQKKFLPHRMTSKNNLYEGILFTQHATFFTFSSVSTCDFSFEKNMLQRKREKNFRSFEESRCEKV